jgi:hypothetical protein
MFLKVLIHPLEVIIILFFVILRHAFSY